MQKIGFIGSGKMAGAIIKGIIKSGFILPENLIATQAENEGLEEKAKSLLSKRISTPKSFDFSSSPINSACVASISDGSAKLFLSKPLIIAPAILPQPINPIFFILPSLCVI